MKKAFTLAELMIVLVVIGILAAILMPVAFQSTPDENVVKFKKANSTFGTLIANLVNSDQYFKDGNMGELPSGGAPSATYLCQAMADNLSIKSIACSSATNSTYAVWTTGDGNVSDTEAAALDTACSTTAATVGSEIIASDSITYYQASPGTLYSSSTVSSPAQNGFKDGYKIFCIDVDGVGVGEAPFGYAVRADGRILPGKRAKEWALKSIQNNDN